MNPAILARLFQAHADALTDGAPMGGQSQGMQLQQEPGNLWDQQPQQQDSFEQSLGAPRGQQSDDGTMPPSDYQYLDRVEGDGNPLGVMFGQQQGEPTGDPTNMPMSQLPPGAQEGQYISPLDMGPRRMSTRRP